MKKLGKSGFNRTVYYCFTFLVIVSLYAINSLFGEQLCLMTYLPMKTCTEICINNQIEDEIAYANKQLTVAEFAGDFTAKILEDRLFQKETESSFQFRTKRKIIEERFVSVENPSS